jgi:hypothetical protein
MPAVSKPNHVVQNVKTPQRHIILKLKIFKEISTRLQKDKVQRFIYGLALIVWTVIWIDNLNLFNADSSLGIKYYWLMIIPTLILLGQILFNLRILWWLTVGLISIYTIWTVWNIVFLRILVGYHRDYVPGTIWDFKEVLTLIMIFLTLFLVNWTFWKIRPEKNKKHFAQQRI